VGECVACTTDNNNADCSHIPSRPQCDAGLCVGCTVATEATNCGGNSCNPATRTCTTTPRLSRGVCQPCVADSECTPVDGATHRCVRMNYQGTDLGGFCLRVANVPGPSGCDRPFVTPFNTTSLSGAASAAYCGIDQTATTCEAVAALLAGLVCPGGTAAECGAREALCETVGFAVNQCTYACNSAVDCPAGGSTGSCAMGYCGS
jgi:hypothetical protein